MLRVLTEHGPRALYGTIAGGCEGTDSFIIGSDVQRAVSSKGYRILHTAVRKKLGSFRSGLPVQGIDRVVMTPEVNSSVRSNGG